MSRSAIMVIGLIFLVIGVVVFAAPVFQTHETHNVAQLGDLKLQAQQTKTYVLPPFLGGGALVLGAALILVGAVQRR